MSNPPKVLLHNNDTTVMAKALMARFPQVDHRSCTTFQDLPQAVQDYAPDVVFSVRFDASQPYPRDALFAPGGPRWVANGGAGTDHYGTWDPDQVTVTNTAGVAADMMAEYVMGGFLHFTLDVLGLQADQAARRWQADRMVRPLKGATLLIIGLGNTGRAIAARAKAFGMHVLGTRARPTPMDNVDEVHAADRLLDLLPRADFVAVCTPLTLRTRGLVSAEAIATMKAGAILADVSRGGVVDQTALHAALQQGRLGGAVLDVFEVEPLPADSPLWALENVLISPHCSAVSEGWEQASFDIFLDNLERWIKGDPLRNVVNPSRGY